MLNQENINPFINKYISFVDELSNEMNYNNNIRHLLYVIVPAFVCKYGVNNSSLVLDTFRKVKIYIRNSEDKYVTASFNRRLVKEDDFYKTEKYIVINEFSTTNLSEIIDNIVHEFNHAINSINNEIIEKEKIIKVRCGIAFLEYNKKDLSFISKSEENTLEEILNTNQTEEVINIIKDFNNYRIDNQEFSLLVYNIRKEIGNNDFVSNAYYYQKTICKSLINNKTFTPTINNLRFKGLVEDVEDLFDNVIGRKNSYKKLNELLTTMHIDIIKYSNAKIFKNMYLNKIRSLTKDVNDLIEEYEQKCIFK